MKNKSWIDTNKITLMQWPAQSPVLLSPIEYLWKQFDIVCLHSRFRNAEELHQEHQTPGHK